MFSDPEANIVYFSPSPFNILFSEKVTRGSLKDSGQSFLESNVESVRPTRKTDGNPVWRLVLCTRWSLYPYMVKMRQESTGVNWGNLTKIWTPMPLFHVAGLLYTELKDNCPPSSFTWGSSSEWTTVFRQNWQSYNNWVSEGAVMLLWHLSRVSKTQIEFSKMASNKWKWVTRFSNLAFIL